VQAYCVQLEVSLTTVSNAGMITFAEVVSNIFTFSSADIVIIVDNAISYR
jgi:hypothetical protein